MLILKKNQSGEKELKLTVRDGCLFVSTNLTTGTGVPYGDRHVVTLSGWIENVVKIEKEDAKPSVLYPSKKAIRRLEIYLKDV